MTNPAEIALQKIITSYGRTRPMVTRLQAFAKASRLYNDIDEGRQYTNLPADSKSMVLRLLQLYALLIRSQERIEDSIAYYPLALSKRAMHKSSELDQTRKNLLHNVHDTISFASNLSGYTQVFEDAYNEISNHPENYPSQSMGEFLSDVSQLRVQRGFLKSAFSHATGFLKEEFEYILGKLNNFAYTHDHAETTKDIQDSYIPENGPDTPDEFLFMMGFLYEHTKTVFSKKLPTYQDMQLGMDRILRTARNMCHDISDKNLAQMYTSLKQNPHIAMHRAFIKPENAPQIAIAMTRHYLERHGDKLQAEDAIELKELLADLYIKVFAHYQEELKSSGLTMDTNDQKTAIDKMLYESWNTWPRPSVEDIIAHCDSDLKTKNKIKFYNLLEKLEPYFELQVSYYAEQSDTVRKLRRNLFRQDSLSRDQESYRSAFIKHLAETETLLLKQAAFSNSDIDFMRRAGKIPAQDKINSPAWNVDHVIDIHAGGTNDFNNLCLMPAWLNQAKNDFLLLQTGLLDTTEDTKIGHWIITLRPRTDPDNKQSKVLILPTAAPQPPQEPEPRCPT